MDKPHFPPPTPKPKEEGAPARTPVLVSRPEPPSDEKRTGAGAAPKLTQEEVRALIAVGGTSSTAWKSSGRRALIVVPVGAGSFLCRSYLGNYDTVFFLAFLAASIVWAALPLWRQQRDGWT